MPDFRQKDAADWLAAKPRPTSTMGEYRYETNPRAAARRHPRGAKNNQVAFLDFSWPSYPPVQLAVHFSGSRIDVLRVNRTREFPLFSLDSADAFAVWLDGFYAALRGAKAAPLSSYTPLLPQ